MENIRHIPMTVNEVTDEASIPDLSTLRLMDRIRIGRKRIIYSPIGQLQRSSIYALTNKHRRITSEINAYDCKIRSDLYY